MITKLRRCPRPFALLRREGRDHVEVLTGGVGVAQRLADLPLPAGASGPVSVLAVVPYRQLAERGFEVVDDGSPLCFLRVAGYDEVPVAEVLAALPAEPAAVRPGGFDIDDATYTDLVRRVLRDEIGRGAGSNFVIHRTFTTRTDGDPLTAALAAFGELLRRERGAYWTFCVHTGDRTFVGASPERHVSVADGLVMMNPISGTYRHPGPSGMPAAPGTDEPGTGQPGTGEPGTDDAHRDGLLRFLADQKEIDELYMVLDEELKMMATVADLGGHVIGPYLKEMTHLSHTEYLLAGRSSLDVREVLRDTMFAPTVTGSPIENACRVIARHEQRGRGYYAGVLALLGHDDRGRQTLDAPILIRCAEFDAEGNLRVPVGATLVRHSVAEHEVAETRAKAGGVLAALGLAPGREPRRGPGLAADPAVLAALASRNATLAPFWLTAREAASTDAGTASTDAGAASTDARAASTDARAASTDARVPHVAGRRVLVVDAEDTFTGMLVHQFRALGAQVTLRSHRDLPALSGFDLVVAGPGPGDPRDLTDPRIATLHRVVRTALTQRQPLLGVCLGHQVLAVTLGLPMARKSMPYQGVQREIDFFGRPERVGFYSTFTAVVSGQDPQPTIDSPYGQVAVSLDPGTGEVHALRGAAFAGVQFHAESVLSEHGIDLLQELVTGLLDAPAWR